MISELPKHKPLFSGKFGIGQRNGRSERQEKIHDTYRLESRRTDGSNVYAFFMRPISAPTLWPAVGAAPLLIVAPIAKKKACGQAINIDT